MIRLVLVATTVFAFLVLVGTPVLIYSLLVGDAEPVYRVGRWGCRMAVWLAGIQMAVEGREKILTDRAVIYMPNHQSNCDPPALISVLPPIRVLPKKEVFSIPILGRAMRLCGFIPVDRKNRERALKAVDEAVEALRGGHSFLVFPEGTRSPDGRLLPFKKGGFVMAIRAQAPIVPVSISGASRIMRKGEFAIRPGTMRITFHNPISTEGRSVGDRGQVMKLVRMAVLAGLADDEKPLTGRPVTDDPRAIHGLASGGRHEIATLHGFIRADVDGEFVLYEHPEKGFLHTFGDGSWKLITCDGTEASGTGAEDLAEYFSRQERRTAGVN